MTLIGAFLLKRFLSISLVTLYGFLFASNVLANCGADEERVASCQMAGQQKSVSICLSGDQAIYRFGPAQGTPELVLRAPLMELGYLRANGARNTIDETVVFSNDDYTYRASFGFRDGRQPDPIELWEIGTVNVSRKNKTVAELHCAPETIRRAYDLLMDKMRRLGRERTTDGQTFPNYEVTGYPGPASESPPCEQEFNVDTCWGLGVDAERGGDLGLALAYYDKSCDAKLGPVIGCYEAGKLYLQSRKLRNYARAYDRFAFVCDSDEIGEGPYACKYLGWMHHTGIGANKDPSKAWSYLARACFLHNEQLMIDAEGCHFFAEVALKGSAPKSAKDELKRRANPYLAYLALAMGCTDGAEGICTQAKSFFASQKAASSAWIAQCDRDIGAEQPATDCAGLIRRQQDYDTTQALRRQIFSRFQDAL
jgi:hypothetical protein